MTSLRSIAASSVLICSRLLGSSDGTSRARGWRWPTGASPAKRVLRITDGEDMAGLVEPGDDFAFSTVCAIATALSKRTNNTIIVIIIVDKRRMVRSPDFSALRIGGRIPSRVMTVQTEGYRWVSQPHEMIANVIRSPDGAHRMGGLTIDHLTSGPDPSVHLKAFGTTGSATKRLHLAVLR